MNGVEEDMKLVGVREQRVRRRQLIGWKRRRRRVHGPFQPQRLYLICGRPQAPLIDSNGPITPLVALDFDKTPQKSSLLGRLLGR